MTNPNLRFRISLVALLLVGVGMAIVVGHARWKHSSLVREARLLEAEGVTLDWDDTWWNWIRPVSVNEATIAVTELPNDRAKIGNAVYTFDEGNAHYDSIAERLQKLGVEEVQVIKFKNGERTIGFVGTHKGHPSENR